MKFTWTRYPCGHFRTMVPLYRIHQLICSANGAYAMITLSISDTTFYIYYVRLSWRHSSHFSPSIQPRQAYFLKHNKSTNRKSTQQKSQTTKKLGECGTHHIKIYNSPSWRKDKKFNRKGYYWSRYILNSVIKNFLIPESATPF